MSYKTVPGDGNAVLIEKKSRFIAAIRTVTTEEQALAFLAALRTRYYDATHNVYAYVLRENNIRRYSDDGEPQGTAGVPVLDVLLKEGLTDVITVVTRYFGGTLLGAGGLVRAYSGAAKLAIDDAGIVLMRRCTQMKMTLPYPLLTGVQNAVLKAEGKIDLPTYGGEVELLCTIPEENRDAFRRAVLDLSAGSVDPAAVGEIFCP